MAARAGLPCSERGTLAPTSLLREFGVLGFGFFQDGDIRVGIFPQREEILVGGAGAGVVASQSAGAPQLQVRQGAHAEVMQIPRWSRSF